MEKAEKLKAEANELFKNERFSAAVDLYTQAISLNPSNAVYFANRSIANHRLENFGNLLLLFLYDDFFRLREAFSADNLLQWLSLCSV